MGRQVTALGVLHAPGRDGRIFALVNVWNVKNKARRLVSVRGGGALFGRGRVLYPLYIRAKGGIITKASVSHITFFSP